MRQGLTPYPWELYGALLAQGDDQEQIAFFKAFLKECKSWGTEYQVQMQLADINRGLTAEEREALKMISYTGEE